MKRIFLLTGLVLSFTAFAQIPNNVTTDALVAYWPFTGNANDVSGNGNNGTVNNATLTLGHTGGGGDAYYFSSANNGDTYIQSNINTTTITTSGAMTLSFWINRVGNGYFGSRVMEFGSCSTCPGQILITWVNGNNPLTLRHYVTTTGFVSYGFPNLNSNTWYHIAYTNDGTTAKYFLNGALVYSVASPATAQLQGNTAFGRMNHPSYDAFNGNLDDIGLWSRALTYCEVANLYTGNAAVSFPFNPLPDTTVICDSIKLDAGAGFSGYAWSNGSTTQATTIKAKGWNYITATNNQGCKAADSTFIDIIKPTITASKMTTCKGGAVMLTATGVTGTTQTLVDQFTQSFTAPWSQTVNTVIGQNYMMILSGTLSDHCVGGDTYNNSDAAYYYDRNPAEKITSANTGSRLFTNWNGQPLRPDLDAVNSTHTYIYTLPASANTSQIFSYADGGGANSYGDNCGQMSFLIYRVQKSKAIFTWSASPASTAGFNVADIHNISLTANPTANTTYYVTVNDGIISCTDSIKITVTTLDTSVAVLDPPMLCSNGGSVRLQAASGLTKYKWLKDGNVITAAANSKDYTATGSGIYRVIVTNSLGCTDTSRSITIATYPKPKADFGINNASQCLTSNSFVFTNNSTISNGSLNYKWSFGDGEIGTAKDTTFSYTKSNPAYTVQLIAISNNGCSDTIAKTVTVNDTPAKPGITAGGSVTICGNGNVVLNSDATNGNQWYKDGAIITGVTSKTYTASSTGSYTVISTINTCASSLSNAITVTVTPIPLTPAITANGPTSICGSGTVLLTSVAATGNQWYKDGAIITGATNKTYTASIAATYTVITATNSCNSNSSAGTVVTITSLPPKPVISATGSLAICDGGSVTLSSDAITGNQWYLNGTFIGGAINKLYAAKSAGVYTVIVDNGCSTVSSDGVTVTVNPSPKSIRYPTVNVQTGTTFPLQARTFGDSYLWTPSTGLDEYNIDDPVTKNFTQTQDYIIQIKTNANCITYDTLLVKAFNIKGIVVPTAFSPNGDGTNDKLKPTLINIPQLIYFRIYNKWGQLIFETADPAKAWDGRWKGTQQAIGNYVWLAQGIDVSGNIVNEQGQVLIIR